MTDQLQDPGYWLDRADETRTAANRVSNPEAKKALYEVTEVYLWLAEQVAFWRSQDKEIRFDKPMPTIRVRR